MKKETYISSSIKRQIKCNCPDNAGKLGGMQLKLAWWLRKFPQIGSDTLSIASEGIDKNLN